MLRSTSCVRVLAFVLILTALFGGPVPGFGAGQASAQAIPSGAIVVAPTVKPWLMPYATETVAAHTSSGTALTATATAALKPWLTPTVSATPAPTEFPASTDASLPSGGTVTIGGLPSGAVVVAPTVKPWLAPLPTDTPTPTRVPASIDLLAEDDRAAATDVGGSSTAAAADTASPSDRLAQPIRVLLLGTDAYNPDTRGRSDTMLLVQADSATGDVRIVSFLRDLYVAIPGHGKTRLNAAYVYGGADLLLETLEQNFGVTADWTVTVSFSRMAALVDRLGGVAVEVSEKERVQLNSILQFYNTKNGYPARDQLLKQSGLQTLTGRQALCYSRIRKTDSDFQRAGRQRKVLEGIWEAVRALDPLQLAAFVADALSLVNTDLTLADALAFAPLLRQLPNATFSALTIPTSDGYRSRTVQGMQILDPNLSQNREAISDFLR